MQCFYFYEKQPKGIFFPENFLVITEDYGNEIICFVRTEHVFPRILIRGNIKLPRMNVIK